METSTYEKKLNYLRAAKLKLENELKAEADANWGDDAMMYKQSLLNEVIKIEKQIIELKDVMTSEVSHPKYTVEINGKQKQFTIVPDSLVSPREGLISERSPLAKKLKNSKTDDVVELETARGKTAYRVLALNI